MGAHRPHRSLLLLPFLLLATAVPAWALLPLDDFLCYRSVTTPGTIPVPVLFDIHLADRYEDVILDAEHQKHVCVPANTGSGFIDRDISLRAKFLRSNGQTPHFVPQRDVTFSDRFGTITVDLVRRYEFFIPTSLDETTTLPPPDASQHDVDHFKCYRTGGVSAPRGLTATVVADRLTNTSRTFNVSRPRELCVPVDKNGEGIKDPNRFLMCYAVFPATIQPPTRFSGLHLNYEYGAEQTDAVRPEALCVPATLVP